MKKRRGLITDNSEGTDDCEINNIEVGRNKISKDSNRFDAEKDGEESDKENEKEKENDNKVGQKETPVAKKSRYNNDKPLEKVPDHLVLKLKQCVPLMFKDIKFFRSWNSVEDAPKVMDYMFHQIGLKNKDSLDERLKRSRLWVCLSKWLYKEISKMRTNKIASFHHMTKRSK